MPDETLSDSSPDDNEVKPEPLEPQESNEPEKTDETPSTTEESAASDQSAPQKGESANSSEELKGSGHRNAETRIKQLTAQINALKRQVQAVTQPAQQAAPALSEPEMPTIDKYETIEAFNEALKEHKSKLVEYAIQKDRIERERESKQKAEKEEIDKTVAAFNKRAERLKATNPDFDPKDVFERIEPNPTTFGLIFDSEVGPEVSAFLDENPEEAERLRGLPPLKCAREFFKLEQKISDQIKGIKKPAAPVKPGSYVTGKAASVPSPKTVADILYS